MKYILNGQNMSKREDAYDELARVLPLPSCFGRNLDALWDVVSCMDVEIEVIHAAAVSGYEEKILTLLQEAAAENPKLTVAIQA